MEFEPCRETTSILHNLVILTKASSDYRGYPGNLQSVANNCKFLNIIQPNLQQESRLPSARFVNVRYLH